MVLQNKYKARASRRYNAARGGLQDGRGRGGGDRDRSRGGYRGNNEESFPSLNLDDDDDDDGEEAEEKGEGDSEEADSAEKVKGKYSKRKLEGNAWRYQEEEKVDPHQGTSLLMPLVDFESFLLTILTIIIEGEEESEPEVDLSGLLERVVKLDSSRTSRALSSKQAVESSLQAENQDIDHSLLYLLDRQRERERGKVGATMDDKANQFLSNNKFKATGGGQLSASELKLLEMEGKKLLQEREREKRHYGRAQMLKYQQPESKVISLNIGENRRKQKEQDKDTKKKPQSSFNMADLYYDDEVDVPQSHPGGNDEDGFDYFLNEVSKAKSSSRTNNLQVSAQKGNEAKQIATATTSIPSSTNRKEDEDFLDSII